MKLMKVCNLYFMLMQTTMALVMQQQGSQLALFRRHMLLTMPTAMTAIHRFIPELLKPATVLTTTAIIKLMKVCNRYFMKMQTMMASVMQG
jgi:hypothetical protein